MSICTQETSTQTMPKKNLSLPSHAEILILLLHKERTHISITICGSTRGAALNLLQNNVNWKLKLQLAAMMQWKV